MSTIDVRFAHPSYTDEQLASSISGILDTNTTLAMATINGSSSYVNTVFYAYNRFLDLFIFTQPHTQHSQNLAKNPSIAIAIWNPPQIWGENLQGLQIFGRCERVQSTHLGDVVHVFSQRFPSFGQLINDPSDFDKGVTESRLYIVKVDTIKLLDEPNLGRRNYIPLTLSRS